MRKRYDIESDEIHRLREEVEVFLSRKLSTPSDFTYLSETMQDHGCGYVSATTIKRVWGYVNDIKGVYTPGSYTLRALCNLLGYADMEEFLHADHPVQSKEYIGKYIESSSLSPDVVITLRWHPNRECRLRHVESTLFEVVESRNSRLRKGDMVECGCFTQHAPAYFSRVFRHGMTPVTYIAGSASGIVFEV